MAKTVDRRPEAGSSPKDVGRQLRHVRRKQGLSRSEVARSAGLTRRELAAYERGRVDIPESDLWCLAGSCGVDVGELLPHRDMLRVDSDLSSLAIGDTIRHLRSPGEPDGLLTEYLSMIYELRNLPPGTRVPLREEDLHTLADALGGSPDVIESRLGELIGANREEAARLRAMILPPLSLPAPGASDAGPGGDFFATPRAADPFAPPPPLAGQGLDAVLAPMEPMDAMPPMEPMEPMEPMPPATPLMEPIAPAPPTAADPTDPLATLPVDPFALPEDPDPLAVLRADPFAPAGDAPLIGPRDVDPDAARDGIVVDFGEPVAGYGTEPDATEPMVAPHTVLDVPAAPLSEAPIDVAGIDVAGLDAPADDILPELDAPVAGAFADAFDTTPADGAPFESGPFESGPFESGPFESVPFDRIPFGIETDVAEPALGAAPIGDDLAPLTDEPPAIDAFLSTPLVTEPVAAEPEPVEPETIEAETFEAETVELETIEPETVAVVAVDEPAAIAWHAPVVALEAEDAPMGHEADTAGNGAAHFTKAGPGWQVGGMSPATAMADDGALALRRAEARWALCDVHQPGDFTAEAVVEFTTGTGFGILFRATVDDHDRVSGYSFDVDPVAGGGGYLIRQWEANRPHWRPLAQAHVTDSNMLYGRHTISLTMRGDQLTVYVDGETVVTIPSLSRLSVDLGREAARGDRLGVQAGTTTEVTVDRFAAAAH